MSFRRSKGGYVVARQQVASKDRLVSLVEVEQRIPSVVDWLEGGWVTPSLPVRIVKRTLDIVLSVVSLILVSPLLLLILIAVVLESPRSPIFVQRRVGRYGTTFGLIKLRTMVPNADERLRECLVSDPALREEWHRTRKLREDPRVTWVGRRLRRFSLDELPQLINVLMGQMSLVGPRPVPADEGTMFGADWPVVLSVRPGLTGLWAVSGRSDVTYSQRVALEVEYVNGCGIRSDLAIMARTVPWVLEGQGSY
jgi:exopolysaccharide production protein ExoY